MQKILLYFEKIWMEVELGAFLEFEDVSGVRGEFHSVQSGVWGKFNLREFVFKEFNSSEVVFE